MTPELQITHTFIGPSRHAPHQVMVARLVGWRQSEDAWRDTRQHLARLIEALRPENVEGLEKSLPPLAIKDEPLPPALCLAWTVITLQRWAGHPTTHYGLCNSGEGTDDDGDGVDFFFDYALATTGKRAARLAFTLMRLAAGPIASQELAAREIFATFAKNNLNNQNRAAYLRLAHERQIPWRSLVTTDAILAFGQGSHIRWISSNFSDRTGFIATQLSTNKFEAVSTLRQYGIPVPRQEIVTDLSSALKASQNLGFPVVVKPLNTDHGTAVSVGLTTNEEVREAFRIAAQHGSVLVESQLSGMHHRLTVIHGKMTSARRQTPAHITGDGLHSIADIVEENNRSRRAHNIWAIDLNEESDMILARAGRTRTTIPAAGEIVPLHSHSNLVVGGTMVEVTDLVHPDNRKLAERTAAIMGIEVAGLDFLCPDISKSYLDVGGGFCEVNVTPAFIFGEHEILFDAWFPPPAAGRIPVIGLLGLDAGLTGRLAAQLAARAGRYSHAGPQGLFIDGGCVDRGANDTATGMARACAEPTSRAALIELDPEKVWREGLGVNQIDILILDEKAGKSFSPDAEKGLELIKKVSTLIQPVISQKAVVTYLGKELDMRLAP